VKGGWQMIGRGKVSLCYPISMPKRHHQALASPLYFFFLPFFLSFLLRVFNQLIRNANMISDFYYNTTTLIVWSGSLKSFFFYAQHLFFPFFLKRKCIVQIFPVNQDYF
jgi:hypothetical protein